MTYKPVTVSDDDVEESYSVVSAIVNRFLVTTRQGEFRIAFGESRAYGSPIHYRVATVMKPFEAYELMKILEQSLEPFKEEIEAMLSSSDQVADNGSK